MFSKCKHFKKRKKQKEKKKKKQKKAVLHAFLAVSPQFDTLW
jgi:hypothetical protein